MSEYLSKKLRDLFLNDSLTLNIEQDYVMAHSIGGQMFRVPTDRYANVNLRFPLEGNDDLYNEFQSLFHDSREFSIHTYDGLRVSGIMISCDEVSVDLILRDYNPNRKDWKDWFIL